MLNRLLVFLSYLAPGLVALGLVKMLSGEFEDGAKLIAVGAVAAIIAVAGRAAVNARRGR